MQSASRREASGVWPSRGAVRVETERGSIALWTIAPHVYATEVQGHMTPAMSQLIIERATPLYAAGHTVYGIHNWLAMSNYDSICRIELTNWILRNKARSVLHIATASRMVAMGVMVAKVALGDLLHAHATLESLERVLADVMKGRR